MSAVIISGSSRNDGDTIILANIMMKNGRLDHLDLNDYAISYYDYEHQNRGDDFIPLMEKLIAEYDTFIFLTPVYWYAMSGIMKVFFDRISDLLTIEKELGRQLRGKNMAVVSCSLGNNLGMYFWMPFIESASYLGMNYLGGLHVHAEEIDNAAIEAFLIKITKN